MINVTTVTLKAVSTEMCFLMFPLSTKYPEIQILWENIYIDIKLAFTRHRVFTIIIVLAGFLDCSSALFSS